LQTFSTGATPRVSFVPPLRPSTLNFSRFWPPIKNSIYCTTTRLLRASTSHILVKLSWAPGGPEDQGHPGAWFCVLKTGVETLAMAASGDSVDPGSAAQRIGIRATFDITQGALLVSLVLVHALCHPPLCGSRASPALQLQ
jgi:hypothetical protein